jgi:hypothetical protein
MTGITFDEVTIEEMILEEPEMLQQNKIKLCGCQQKKEITKIYNTIALRHQTILYISRRVKEFQYLFFEITNVVSDEGRDFVEQRLIDIENAKEHPIQDWRNDESQER